MNPECRNGKHANCDERVWNDELDALGACYCTCHLTTEDLLDEYRGLRQVRPLWLAISKVLEIHVPDDEYPEPKPGRMSCVECNRADQEGLRPTWWPCPTVTAIRAEMVKGRTQ